MAAVRASAHLAEFDEVVFCVFSEADLVIYQRLLADGRASSPGH
jgi:hypothetical protein